MVLAVQDVRAFQSLVLQDPAESDPEQALTLIRALEECRNAVTACQAQLAVAGHDAQRAADMPRGIQASETTRVVGAQLGLARRISPRLGTNFLGVAQAVTQMPHTRAALQAGVIGEWQVAQLVAETAFLTLADRQRVDEAIKDLLGKVPDRHLTGAAKAAAYRADPEALEARRAKAEKGRRVSLCPAPDSMALLTALLPVADGVACLAALNGAAPLSADDRRGRDQLVADELVRRITVSGAAPRSAGRPSGRSTTSPRTPPEGRPAWRTPPATAPGATTPKSIPTCGSPATARRSSCGPAASRRPVDHRHHRAGASAHARSAVVDDG